MLTTRSHSDALVRHGRPVEESTPPSEEGKSDPHEAEAADVARPEPEASDNEEDDEVPIFNIFSRSL
jgi:hypothetical protein